MQRRDNYACNRVRIFLTELSQGNHNSKYKALVDFHSYLDMHRPLISDDTVDFLLTGQLDTFKTTGLLKHIGSLSEKKKGEAGGELLKRISACLIRILKYLVIDLVHDESIYNDRFLHLATSHYIPMRLDLHIMGGNKLMDLKATSGSSALASTNSEPTADENGNSNQGNTTNSFRDYTRIYMKYSQFRGGNSTEAFELIKLLYENHMNDLDELEEISLPEILHHNKSCLKAFSQWYQNFNNHLNLDQLDAMIGTTPQPGGDVSGMDSSSLSGGLSSLGGGTAGIGGISSIDPSLDLGVDLNNLYDLDGMNFSTNVLPSSSFQTGSMFEEIISNNNLSSSILNQTKNTKKNYPNTWKKLNYTKLPLQHDELNERNFFIVENMKRNKENMKKNNKNNNKNKQKVVKDPLNLYDINLYEIEKLYKIKKKKNEKNNKKFKSMLDNDMEDEEFEKHHEEEDVDEEDEEDEDDDDVEDMYDHYEEEEDDEEEGEDSPTDSLDPSSPLKSDGRYKKKRSSILPTNKNFSITNYMKIIHKKTPFSHLVVGIGNLEKLLLNYNNYRSYLIVKFYNYFIEFFEEIYWLKTYRLHIMKNEREEELQEARSLGTSDDYTLSKTYQMKANPMLNELEDLYDKDGKRKIQVINGIQRLNTILSLINVIKKKNVHILYPIIKKKKNYFIIKKLKALLKNSIKNIVKYPSLVLFYIKKGSFFNLFLLFKQIFLLKNNIKIFINIKNICNNLLLNFFSNVFSQLFLSNTNFLGYFQDVNPKNHNAIISTSNSIAGSLIANCRIFLTIQGPIYYLVALRQTFLRFYMNFLEKLKEIRNKFVIDSLDALNTGHEFFLNSTNQAEAGGGATSNIFTPPPFFPNNNPQSPQSSSSGGEIPIDENNFFSRFMSEKNVIQLFTIIKRYTNNTFFPSTATSQNFNSSLYSAFTSSPSLNPSKKNYTSDNMSDAGVDEGDDTSSSIFSLNQSPTAPTSSSNPASPNSFMGNANINEIMREELDDEIDFSLENCIYDFFQNTYSSSNNFTAPGSIGPAGPNSGFLGVKGNSRANYFTSDTAATSQKDSKKIDYIFLLTNIIRRNLVENVMLLLFHYYPLLFSLHFEILRFSTQELPAFLDNASMALINYSGGALGGGPNLPRAPTSTTYPYASSTLLPDITLAVFDPYINSYFPKKSWYNMANKTPLSGSLSEHSTATCLSSLLNLSMDFIYQGLTGVGTQTDSISAATNLKKPVVSNETNAAIKELCIFVNILYNKINLPTIKIDSQDIRPFVMEGLSTSTDNTTRGQVGSSYTDTMIQFSFQSNYPLENQKFSDVSNLNYFKTSLVGNFYASAVQNIMVFYDFLDNSYDKAHEILIEKENETKLKEEEAKKAKEEEAKARTISPTKGKETLKTRTTLNTQTISQEYIDLDITSTASRIHRSYLILQAMSKEAQLLYLLKVNRKFLEKINIIFMVCFNSMKKKDFFLVFYNNLIKKLKYYYLVKKINRKIKKKISVFVKSGTSNKNSFNKQMMRRIVSDENMSGSRYSNYGPVTSDDEGFDATVVDYNETDDDTEDEGDKETLDELEKDDDEEIEEEELYVDKILNKINNIKKIYSIPCGVENFFIQYENLVDFFNTYLQKKKFFLTMSYNFYIVCFINNISYVMKKIKKFFFDQNNFLLQDSFQKVFDEAGDIFSKFSIYGDDDDQIIEGLSPPPQPESKPVVSNPFGAPTSSSATSLSRLNAARKEMANLEQELLRSDGLTYDREMTSLFTKSSSSSVINRDSSSKKTSPISSSNIKTDLFFASYAHHNTLSHLISMLTSASSSATTSFSNNTSMNSASSTDPLSPHSSSTTTSIPLSTSNAYLLSITSSFDLIRGLLRLRTYTLSKLLARTNRVFPISLIQESYTSTFNNPFSLFYSLNTIHNFHQNATELIQKKQAAPVGASKMNGSFTVKDISEEILDAFIRMQGDTKLGYVLKPPNSTSGTPGKLGVASLNATSDPSPMTYISRYLLDFFREVINLEASTFSSYISSRVKNYRSLIHTAYSERIKIEKRLRQNYNMKNLAKTSNTQLPASTPTVSNLPPHLTKICLLLHEDKRVLTQFLYNSSIIHGNNSNGNYSLTSLSNMIAKNPSIFSINSLPLQYSTPECIITSKFNPTFSSSFTNMSYASGSTSASTSPLHTSPFYTSYPIASDTTSSLSEDALALLIQNAEDIEDIMKNSNTKLDNTLSANIDILNQNKFFLLNHLNFFLIEVFKSLLMVYKEEIAQVRQNLFTHSNFDENSISDNVNIPLALAAALVASNVEQNFTPYAALAQIVEEFEFFKITFSNIVRSKKFRVDEDLREIMSQQVDLTAQELMGIEEVKKKILDGHPYFIETRDSLLRNSQLLIQLFS